MARHCRLCYNVGHNRRTCPSANNGSSSTNSTQAKTMNRNGARCSYCLRHSVVDRTHNVRNCSRRRNDAVAWADKNKVFAEKFVQSFPKYGIGVGSIVEKTYHLDNPRYYVVTHINWDNISHDNFYSAFTALPIDKQDDDAYSWQRQFDLPRMSEIMETEYSDTVVLSTIPERMIINQIPHDFHLGYYGMPDKLRDKPRRRRRRR